MPTICGGGPEPHRDGYACGRRRIRATLAPPRYLNVSPAFNWSGIAVCLFGGMTKDESGSHSVPSLLARMIHGSPVLIIFFWLGLAVLVNTVVPQLEK